MSPSANADSKSDYAQATAPSRSAVVSSVKKGGKKGGNKGDPEKPDYISPEPKNASEKRDWDRMSTRMEGFHSYFRSTFQQMWEAADKVGEGGISLKVRTEHDSRSATFKLIEIVSSSNILISAGSSKHTWQVITGEWTCLVQIQLLLNPTISIEERHIFPVLAKRLPEFGDDHPAEHAKIHEGIDRFMAYINLCRANPTLYSAADFRKVLASFGPILMYHLDAEVKTLQGENLRRYYTIEETSPQSIDFSSPRAVNYLSSLGGLFIPHTNEARSQNSLPENLTPALSLARPGDYRQQEREGQERPNISDQSHSSSPDNRAGASSARIQYGIQPETFNEGRAAWSNSEAKLVFSRKNIYSSQLAVTLNARNLALMIWVHTPPTTLPASQLVNLSPEELEMEELKGLIEKRSMISLVEAFAVSAKHYLRGEYGVFYEDLYHLVAALPKYSFPSSVDATEETAVLGLWRHPGADGKTFVPANMRRPQGAATPMSTSTLASSSAGGYCDLEKGNGDPRFIELLPASNPPKPTLYHHCPPLLLFRVRSCESDRRGFIAYLTPLFLISIQPILRLIFRRLDTGSHSKKERRKKQKGKGANANVPLQITLFLSGYVHQLISRGTLEPPLFGTFLAPVQALQDRAGLDDASAIRLCQSPAIFGLRLSALPSVSVSSQRILDALTKETPGNVLPLKQPELTTLTCSVGQCVASTMFLGFMELGQQLEQPFGYDDSDLDLDHFCELISEELQEIVAHPNPSLDFVFADENQPFGPDDTRSAVEILNEREGVLGFRRQLAKHFHVSQKQKDSKLIKRMRSVEVLSI
ncbi:ion channel-forming bestrophin family protein, partial [Phenoliferia sp. Uapishka_3]